MIMLPPNYRQFTRIAVACFLLLPLYSIGQSVDPLTGNLQYSIPLGEVGANDISVPVSISQHGNAVTVPEGESQCGVGWSLIAGGAVTRLVRGLPDELNETTRKGWMNLGSTYTSIQGFTPGGDDSLAVCSDEASSWTFLNGLNMKDTEPDVFYFQAPGIGGHFILNAAGEPQLLSLQDITISNFDADTFLIRTNLGLAYLFTATEQTTRTVGGPGSEFTEYVLYGYYETTFTTRWLLTSIESTATGTTATIDYDTLPGALSVQYREDSLYHFKDSFQPKRISTISVKTYQAQFNWANELLNSVKFTETSTGVTKKVDFSYQTFKDYNFSATNKIPLTRTFLRNIREVGPSCNPNTSFEFTYAGIPWNKNSLAKPWKKTWKQDFFGFYNGDADNKNVPTVYFYNNEPDKRRVRVSAITGVTASTTLTGQNRNVVVDSAKFGALTKIVTPAGGVVEITWEGNSYYDSATFENKAGGGVRVQKISMNGSDVAYGKTVADFSPYRSITRSYEYKESDGTTSSGKLLAPLKFGYYTLTGVKRSKDNRGDAPEIMYARVKELIDTLGSTVYEFSIPGVFPQTEKYEWKATKSRLARSANAPNCDCGNYRNGYFAYPFPPSTNFGHRRGFLKVVSQYSAGGTLVRKRELKAMQLPASPPAAVKAIRYEKANVHVYYYGVYEILTGRAQVVSSEKVTEYPESGSTPMITSTKYTYNSNNMLAQVTDTLADGSYTVKTMKYAKDYNFTGTPTQSAAVAIKALNNTYRHGTLIEQTLHLTQAGGSAVLMDASLVGFKTFGNGKVLPAYMLSVPRGVSVTASSVSGGVSLVTDADYDTARIFNDYDSEGRVLWESDEKKNKVAHSYANAYGYEAATFANTSANTSVHDGFETASTAGLTVSGGSATYSAGWTGDKAIVLSTGLTLTSATLTKGSVTKFRISCWAKASAATSVYFKSYDGTEYTIGTLSVDNSNQWKYYETTVTPATVPTLFVVRVTSSGTVTLDDVIFVPVQARVALQTVKPMTGPTSATDDRGNSVAFAYDEQRRKVATFDRKRNMVQKIEYKTQKQLSANPTVGILTSADYYLTNTSTLFTALQYCEGFNDSYVWKVDNVVESTTSTMNKTFIAPGRHNISLKVTKGAVVDSVMQTICVGLGGIPQIEMDDEPVSLIGTNCETPNFTLTAAGLPASGGGCTTTVYWRKLTILCDPGGGCFIWATQTLGSGTSIEINPTAIGTAVIRADVQISCSQGSDLSCLGDASHQFSLWLDVQYDSEHYCP